MDAVELEIMTGLARTPKQISPKYFYDQQGSELFDAITELDEYYVPRVEKEIFSAHRDAICEAIGEGVTLVEPGAGSCEKVKWLLPDLEPSAYVPMDISGEHLQASASALKAEFDELTVMPQVCDHTQGIDLELPVEDAPPVFFYPGSSIGNFEPDVAVDFLRDMRAQMNGDGGLLIGVDAKKDTDVLHAAYNDAEGVTAQFNLNVLDNLNNLLGGNLDSDKFEHHALYNDEQGRIEMHLRCTEAHAARLAGHTIRFADGELVHTENSYKYHPEEFVELAEQAGFEQSQLWQDNRGWFSVLYFEPA
ncbi:MAG: L-histidine N(alpha)-methyltransferase [Gammaproteobacteria bacterium]|nr:L-histidine N(alpha)-methyltransferase [Gammaproteobacteria bacterium]